MAEINWADLIIPMFASGGIGAALVGGWIDRTSKRAAARLLIETQKSNLEIRAEEANDLLDRAREEAERTVSNEVLRIGLNNVTQMQQREQISIQREQIWLGQISAMQTQYTEYQRLNNEKLDRLAADLKEMKDDNDKKSRTIDGQAETIERQARRITTLEADNETLRRRIAQLEAIVPDVHLSANPS